MSGNGSLPFSPASYHARRLAVCDAMGEHGLDLLYVTSPVNLQYLTGYAANWYPPRLPVGVVIERSSGGAKLFDWSRREAYASARAMSDALYLIDYGSAPQTIAEAFAGYGWSRARIGIEFVSPTPVAQVTQALVSALQAGGASVCPGDWIVDTVRLYKSAEELALIRRAAAIADDAMSQIAREIRPGMTAIALSVRMSELLVRGGSDYAALPPIVCAGPNAAFDLHAPMSHRGVEVGDIVGVDCCAAIAGYHASLARSFLIGGGEHVARDWLAASGTATGILRDAASPGAGTETAAQAAEAYLRTIVPAENVWWIGGYSFGLAAAPSWVGHAYLANTGAERCTWVEGFVSNYETIFVDTVQGFAAEAIDTVVMSDGRLDVLSALPRTLIDVPA